MNANLMLYSSELSQLTQDPHPLDYLRTYVPVQQFEEFYETYGVKEGDSMYLAPEDRVVNGTTNSSIATYSSYAGISGACSPQTF